MNNINVNYVEKVVKYLNESDINMKSRKQEHLFRRYHLMVFLKRNTNETWVRIGKLFGKDHATVMNAYKVYDSVSVLPNFDEITEDCQRQFQMDLPELSLVDGSFINNLAVTESLSRLEKYFNKL